jgi:uncharacterized phage-associated protein
MQTAPITNHLLHAAYRDKNDADLTPLRVQKLLYFVHGWYMAITGTSLFTEPFVRGKYGPKLLSLDVDLAQYAGVPVADYIKEWDAEQNKMVPFFVKPEAVPQFAEVLERVWKEYSRYSTAQLSTMSHGPDSAWARTPDGSISNTLIVDEFLRLAAANRARTSASA